MVEILFSLCVCICVLDFDAKCISCGSLSKIFEKYSIKGINISMPFLKQRVQTPGECGDQRFLPFFSARV